MRLITLLFFSLFLASFPAAAQEALPVYQIMDVKVDVTSDNATIARDLAIVQAQQSAYVLLLERIGGDSTIALPPDDVIATLVQAIDVQKEFVTGTRYTGTFSVQFKPQSVRNYLNGSGASFVENPAQPFLVLPILQTQNRSILWEESTPWHIAWAEQAKNSVLVPLIIPTGDLDDIAKISTQEALQGNANALRAIIEKYGAHGAIVPVLQADFNAPESQAVVDTRRYDEYANTLTPEPFTLAPLHATEDPAKNLAKGIKQIAANLEHSWREENKAPTGPSFFLPVHVSVPNLVDWTRIRNRMKQVTPVVGSQIIAMSRGLVHAEIEFRGDMTGLQKALFDKGLILEQSMNGGWTLRNEGDY